MTPGTVAHQASWAHGISQAGILEWVAIFFSRGTSWPRDQTCVSFIGRQILHHWATWKACKAITRQKKIKKNLPRNTLCLQTMGAKIKDSLFFFSFIFISWRLITLQYCIGFCHILTWISHVKIGLKAASYIQRNSQKAVSWLSG